MSSDISQILEKSESETLEFKGARAPLEMLAKVVCGMLNQRGGVVVWGVQDKGGVTGVSDAEKRAGELNEFLMRHLNPRPLLSVSVTNSKKTQLVVIDVPESADKPYSLDREIWVRVGEKTFRASEDESTRIVEKSAAQLDRWERERMPGFGMDDCDPDEFEQARTEIERVGRFGLDVPQNNEELLRQLNLSKSGQLTNAAVVLFARQPRVWAPNLAVRIVSGGGQGGGTTSIENDVILEGPAIRVLREAVGVVQQRTGFSGRFDIRRLERETRPAYALFALREGLVNAMVHRDYTSIGGSVQVDIFRDHLVIRNPGELPNGWTPGDLAKKHESRPTNPDIARVFYLRELMEQLGMGTQKLIGECKALNAKSPVWKTERGTVFLTLFAAPEPSETISLVGRQAQFLEKTKLGAEFKVSDYSDAAKVSERQARRDLAELEKVGLVERHGKGPATSYRRSSRSPGRSIRPNPAKSGQGKS